MIKSVIAVAADNNILIAFPAYRDFNYFECDVSLTEGITFEGEEDTLESTLNCETDPDHEFGDVVFSLEGNTDEFFHGLDLSHGDVRIKVPIDAVSDHDIIEINDTSSTQIVITYTGDDRRKLVQRPSIGSMFVLVIRVSDDTDSTGRKKVAQSASKLNDDIFNWRNNNLVSIYQTRESCDICANSACSLCLHNCYEQKMVYKKCSDNKLQIKPAQGNGIVKGVIDLKAPSNICSMTYQEVGNWAFSQNEVSSLFSSGSYAKITHKMIIMPNAKSSNGQGCVDFRGGAAWGQVNRSITWFQSKSASYPAVQVHEFGHNLGMKHSGAPDSNGNFKEYLDGSGYMGNRAIWDEEGSNMCFNAAKMWYFQWWSSFHKTVWASSTIQSAKLIPLADVKKDRYVSGSNMLLQVPSTDSTLYMIFNRAKGVNEGVRADANKVVITEQNGRTVVSKRKAALGRGDSYRQGNWNGSGKTLVVKVTDINYGSYADIADLQIYFEGTAPDVSSGCKDIVPRGRNKWYDADGADYDCNWYANKASNCASYGDQYSNFGMTANEACCACQ
jgi:hypothetical protein